MPEVPGTWTPWGADGQAVAPVSFGDRSDSAVRLDDGRILYVWVEGSSIKQGYAPNLSFFLSNGSISDITTITDSASKPNAVVFRSPSGQLYLITVGTAYSSAAYKGTLLWSSPSGEGGDWVLRATIDPVSTDPSLNDWQYMATHQKAVGEPWFSPTGRWVLSAPRWMYRNDVSAGLLLFHWNGIWTSDDQGLTWTLRTSHGYYSLNAAYSYAPTRNVTLFAGKLWWSTAGNVNNSKLHSSADEGITWVLVHTSADAPQLFDYVVADDTWMYRLNLGKLSRSTTPEVHASFAAVASYPGMAGTARLEHAGQIVQRLGGPDSDNDGLVFIHDGRVWAPMRTGWVIGRIPIGG